MKVLFVTEGSGGHLIPALEVAQHLARAGAQIKFWYAPRRQTVPLMTALAQITDGQAIEVAPLPIGTSSSVLRRLWACGQLWQYADRCFDSFAPDVVVGFGGWVTAPVVLAARRRHIGCLLHEQNVLLGRANRFLVPWVDRIAVSFPETQTRFQQMPSVMTGLPVRRDIGQCSRAKAAARFGLEAHRSTLLILGGSQGARVLNHLMMALVAHLSAEERRTWQFVHVTGLSDEAHVRRVYTAATVSAWVTPFLADMETAYAQADVVIARAGASTIAELARCGMPAILVPFPGAGGHQRANAAVVEAAGGGLMLEEADATPERVLAAVHQIMSDRRLRTIMGAQMRTLDVPDATERLTQAIVTLSGVSIPRQDAACAGVLMKPVLVNM